MNSPGDFGERHHDLGDLCEDSFGVADLDPHIIGNRGGRLRDGAVLAGGDRTVGTAAAGRGYDVGAVIGAVRPQDLDPLAARNIGSTC